MISPISSGVSCKTGKMEVNARESSTRSSVAFPHKISSLPGRCIKSSLQHLRKMVSRFSRGVFAVRNKLKGIRYGAAGSWEYPEPVIRWQGVYDATQGSGLPVLFYIHGGGFTGGCGHEKHFDGSYIAKAVMSSGYGVNKMFGSANPPDWRPTTDGQDKVLCLGEKETHMGKPSALKMYFTMLTKKLVGE